MEIVSSQEKNDKRKEIAKESVKTRKAREKLQKRFALIDAQITKEAQDRKSLEIHRWISRHAEWRVSLKDKSISLFDENRNAALISAKIGKLAQKLQEDHLSD